MDTNQKYILKTGKHNEMGGSVLHMDESIGRLFLSKDPKAYATFLGTCREQVLSLVKNRRISKPKVGHLYVRDSNIWENSVFEYLGESKTSKKFVSIRMYGEVLDTNKMALSDIREVIATSCKKISPKNFISHSMLEKVVEHDVAFSSLPQVASVGETKLNGEVVFQIVPPATASSINPITAQSHRNFVVIDQDAIDKQIAELEKRWADGHERNNTETCAIIQGQILILRGIKSLPLTPILDKAIDIAVKEAISVGYESVKGQMQELIEKVQKEYQAKA